MTVELFPFQREAADWLATKPRALLADEYGVGKTYAAIAAAYCASGPRLVVCPPYLINTWATAIAEYDSAATIRRGVGSPDQRFAAIGDPDAGWILVSYQMLGKTPSNYDRELLRRQWSTVILDEAHALRGRKNHWTVNAWKLKADRIWMLSGTPVIKDFADLWPLLRLCDPRQFSSYWRFVTTYGVTVVTPWKTEIVGVKDIAGLRLAYSPYVLRRTLAETDPDGLIPDYQRIPILVELDTKESADIATARDTYRLGEKTFDSAGALLAMERQLTATAGAKLGAMLGILGDHPTERIIVWCWHKSTAQAAYNAILGRFPSRLTVSITGDDSAARRDADIAAWRAADDSILVATIAALGTGVNLQESACCVFLEKDWLPATNGQAIARLHRRGQRRIVTVYDIMAITAKRGPTVDTVIDRVAANRETANARVLAERLIELPTEPERKDDNGHFLI